MKTIKITRAILKKLNEAIEASISFERLTGKQLNITSIVGEVFASKKLNLELVVNDINPGFDAIDKDGKKVQIKTRRFHGNNTAQTGNLLNKNFKVSFDYALLVLLDKEYKLISIYRIERKWVEEHFKNINERRQANEKGRRKTLSISQFISINQKNTEVTYTE
ncbi:MAG: DUF6998 domain-containing protein [Bacteroidia bacterium]